MYLAAAEVVTRARSQGIAVAIAALNRLHGEPTMVCDVLRSLGITLADIKHNGVEAYDLAEIRKCLMQGDRSDRAQAMAIAEPARYGRSPLRAALPHARTENAKRRRKLVT